MAAKDLVRPSRSVRRLDQVQFIAELQLTFYLDMQKYLRNELGAKWLISASNWTTVPGLEFIERYTYSGVDVIDKHAYYEGKHTGTGANWSVRAGHVFKDKTALFDPASAPFQIIRLPGHPHVQTEIAWQKPNRYVGEAQFLISAYASLQDMDGIVHFRALSGDWETVVAASGPT